MSDPEYKRLRTDLTFVATSAYSQSLIGMPYTLPGYSTRANMLYMITILIAHQRRGRGGGPVPLPFYFAFFSLYMFYDPPKEPLRRQEKGEPRYDGGTPHGLAEDHRSGT